MFGPALRESPPKSTQLAGDHFCFDTLVKLVYLLFCVSAAE